MVLAIMGYLGKKYFEGGKVNIKPGFNISGKIVFITGANAGIGQTTAEELAKLGAQIIMACRDISKA